MVKWGMFEYWGCVLFQRLFQIMQGRVESKSRLPQYTSLKEYETAREGSKKTSKVANNKSNKKVKPIKNNNHSASKNKLPNKNVKNNENVNQANFFKPQTKSKIQHPQPESVKGEVRKQVKLKRNSSEKLIRTKSTLKITLKTDRNRHSPSPISIKEACHLQSQRPKIVRNVTSRSEKEKKSTLRSKEEGVGLKREKSKVNIVSKKQEVDRNLRNRPSIKTQMSSKTHSVIKEEEKKKIMGKPKQKGSKKQGVKHTGSIKIPPKDKKPKIKSTIQQSILYSEVSFQQYPQDHPYDSAIVHNDHYFLPYPNPKTVKTQGCQIQSKSLHRYSTNDHNRAAIKIQSFVRGYITRKYINQAKYIIGKVKIIQNWWRQMLKKKNKKITKALSIENSLITIKDFNDTFKTDKQRLFSESKENTLSNNKLNIKELIKNILEEEKDDSQMSQDDHNASSLSLEKSINKQVYIERKIKNEINSQRVFNSPKHGSPSLIRTPTHSFPIREFFNANSNQKQKIKELLQSPRLASPPAPLKNTPQPQQPHFLVPHQQSIQPFQTKFSSIQEICLLLVDYFRDKQGEMQIFLNKVQSMKYFRSQIVLKYWNCFVISSQHQQYLDDTLAPDYQFMQNYQRPVVFSPALRDEILQFPQVEIDLNSKRFNLEYSPSAPIHRCFLEMIFDVMEQAFYEPFRHCIVGFGKPLTKHVFHDNQSIFENIFSTALGHLFSWGEVMCGLMVELPPEQEGMREMRMKEFERRIEPWDMGCSSQMGIKLEVSEEIIEELVSELCLWLRN